MAIILSLLSATERFSFQDHVANKLDLTLFPYVKDPPAQLPVAPSMRSTPSQTASLRSAKPSWHRAAKPGAPSETRQRIMVFVAGGLTYSEVREVYQLSNSLGKDIYIGTFVTLIFSDQFELKSIFFFRLDTHRDAASVY